MENNLNFWKMEDDLIFGKMDDLKFVQDDLKFFLNGIQPHF